MARRSHCNRASHRNGAQIIISTDNVVLARLGCEGKQVSGRIINRGESSHSDCRNIHVSLVLIQYRSHMILSILYISIAQDPILHGGTYDFFKPSFFGIRYQPLAEDLFSRENYS